MKKKPKRRYTRLIDLICNIILLVLCLNTIGKALSLAMLPTNWLIMIIAILLLIFAIYFVLMLKRLPNWAVIAKRIVLVGLCWGIWFAGNTMGNMDAAVTQISTPEAASDVKIYVLAHKDSAIHTSEDLRGAAIGVQNGTDAAYSAYARQQLDQTMADQIIYQEELSYASLASLFLANMLDGMIISEDYLNMLNANEESFQDSYQIIETYKRQRMDSGVGNKDVTKEGFTLLISGVDEMGAADMTSLSDVNILLFINPITNSITMLSLPRDSLMPRYSMNQVNDKLTHTGWNGIEDTKKTIENFFGIEIDYYAKVSFSSLIAIVDAIGGIDIDVEIAFSEQDENRSFADEDLITLEAGFQHINGKQALAYARHRKTEGYDTAGRERAQERIIKAIIDKLLTPEGITVYVNRLMETVPKYVVTSMPGKQITAFIKGELEDLKPWSIQSITVENGIFDTRAVPNIPGGADCYLWNRYDYAHVLDAYEASKKVNDFQSFNFNFHEYMKYLPEPSDNPNIVWDFLAIDPH